MEEILTIANKLGGVSFATLLLVILWGSWKHVWIWGRDADRIEARHQAEQEVLANERDWWRNVALRATGIAETQGQLLRVRENRATKEMEDINRRLVDE